ncbi:ABC-type spermidine/putrescine transport system permease subunit II [Inquilinus ginsengisoli]|uniref:ABC transporter permease n=1 Tax=Inquilinus ginsengisoli TaxID=363840 RepID=UPI003D1BABBF
MTAPERIVITALWLVAALVFAALYGPALAVVTTSFFDLKGQSIDWSSFSLHWYAGLTDNPEMLAALGHTLVVAAASVLLALILALGLAWYMKTGTRRGRPFVEFVIFLPFVLPGIITGISLLVAFRELGIERSLVTVTIGHTVLVLAILYRMVSVRLDSLETSQIEASLDLGATGLQTFLFVVLPQLRSAIVTGALLAFTLSFDETLVTFFLVGGDATLPIRLWAMMRVGFTPEVNALVALVLLATMTLAVLGALSLKDSMAARR